MSCIYCTRKEKMMGVYIDSGALVVPVAELIEGRLIEREERISIDACPWCGERLTDITPYQDDDTVRAPICNVCGSVAARGETWENGREAVTMFQTSSCRCQPPRRTPLPELTKLPENKRSGDMVQMIKAMLSAKATPLTGITAPTMFEKVRTMWRAKE